MKRTLHLEVEELRPIRELIAIEVDFPIYRRSYLGGRDGESTEIHLVRIQEDGKTLVIAHSKNAAGESYTLSIRTTDFRHISPAYIQGLGHFMATRQEFEAALNQAEYFLDPFREATDGS